MDGNPHTFKFDTLEEDPPLCREVLTRVLMVSIKNHHHALLAQLVQSATLTRWKSQVRILQRAQTTRVDAGWIGW